MLEHQCVMHQKLLRHLKPLFGRYRMPRHGEQFTVFLLHFFQHRVAIQFNRCTQLLKLDGAVPDGQLQTVADRSEHAQAQQVERFEFRQQQIGLFGGFAYRGDQVNVHFAPVAALMQAVDFIEQGFQAGLIGRLPIVATIRNTIAERGQILAYAGLFDRQGYQGIS